MGKNRHNRGVTIVEFMIVLVVMGLLLGGILKGQELINNAKVKKIAYNISSVRTAYGSFVERYRAYPGDFRQASGYLNLTQVSSDPTALNGDGNGRIESATEGALALNHLTTAGMFICSICRGVYNDAVSRANSPVNPYGGLYALFATPVSDYISLITPTVASQHPAVHAGAFIPVAIAAEIDLKIDDGVPYSGAFRAALKDSLGQATDGADCVQLTQAGGTGGSQSVWNVTGADVNCPGILLL